VCATDVGLEARAERPLGFIAATSLVVGGVIGIGIFLTPAEMARSLAAPGWVFGMWLVVGLMAACGALCYGELAARFPQAGGPYVYLRSAYGGRVAFLYGWQCLLVMDPGITAALAVGAAQYAAHLIHLTPSGARALAIAAITLLAGLTALGTRVAARLLVGLTVLKVGVLLAIVVWGFASSAADPARLHPLFERAPGAEPLLPGLAGGFVAAFFSYGGWWEAAKMAGEVRRPSRTLPLAFVTGIAVVTAVYLLASAVFLGVLPPAEALSPEVSAALLGERLFGPAGGRVLAATVLLSAMGSLAALVLSSPRLYVAMAADGLFPVRLGAPHRRLGTPVGAIAVQAGLACVLVAVGTFGDIVAYFVFTTVAFITLSVASIYVLRPPEGTFRPPGRRVAAAVFIAISTVLLALVATGRPLAAAAGVAMVALGVPAYALRRRLEVPGQS
jgi:basic amino acid/polyamine antiporter, APA family